MYPRYMENSWGGIRGERAFFSVAQVPMALGRRIIHSLAAHYNLKGPLSAHVALNSSSPSPPPLHPLWPIIFFQFFPSSYRKKWIDEVEGIQNLLRIWNVLGERGEIRNCADKILKTHELNFLTSVPQITCSIFLI